jgi:hypothetical protein
MTKFLGFIAYEGPSEIDGSPIVVIVNKIDSDSKNDKTGAIVKPPLDEPPRPPAGFESNIIDR